MAEIARNQPLRFDRNDVRIRKEILDNSVAQHVYRGSALIIDASADTIYPRIYQDATVLVANTDVFIGFALEEKNVATTDTETDNEIEVVEGGVVGIKSAVFTDADRGKTVMMTDSGTLAAGVAAAGQLQIGKLRYVEDGYAFIELSSPLVQSF